MENISAIKDSLADFARDTKLNISQVLTSEGSPGLTNSQIWLIASACAWATKNKSIVQAVKSDAATQLSPEEQESAKAAASIMAMNNIYYRFVHLGENDDIKKLPARLRMNVIAKSGVPKADFELMCLAVSAINGCGMCIHSHVEELKKAGVSIEGIQSSARIASVLNSLAQAHICTHETF